MKILMASHYFVSHNGGVELVANELYRRLGTRDQVVVWLAGDATPPPEPLAKSHPVPLPIFNFVEQKIGLPFPIPTPGSLRKISREVSNADILILHDCLYLSNIFAFLLAQCRSVPTIIIQHIGFVPYTSKLLKAAMRLANAIVTRPMLSRATQVVFISETTRNFFGHLSFKRPPEIVFNGVDTDIYRAPNTDENRDQNKDELRREHNLPEDRPAILDRKSVV